MKKLLFAAILGSMAMASCSNEDTVAPGAPSTDGSKSNLRIEMIVDGISTKGNTEGMMTGGHPWVDGDQIRLFTLDHDKFEADGTVEKYSGADFLNKGYKYVAAQETWKTWIMIL